MMTLKCRKRGKRRRRYKGNKGKILLRIMLMIEVYKNCFRKEEVWIVRHIAQIIGQLTIIHKVSQLIKQGSNKLIEFSSQTKWSIDNHLHLKLILENHFIINWLSSLFFPFRQSFASSYFSSRKLSICSSCRSWMTRSCWLQLAYQTWYKTVLDSAL